MAEDLTFEVPAQNTSHRMFLTPELMREDYPNKRDRHEFKKLFFGPVGKQPRDHADRPDGPSKNNRQKYARRARRRAG